jgi:hypothetical protein
MQKMQRNDKVHQQLEQLDYMEAQYTLAKLHGLLAQPGRKGLSVGEMVSVAASMGLLHSKTYHRN